MSSDSVARFFEMLDKDDEVREEYASLTDQAVKEAVRETVIGIASRHGCNFGPAELEEFLEARSEELDDEALDQVAGGALPIPLPRPAAYSTGLVQLLQPAGRVSVLPLPPPRTFR